MTDLGRSCVLMRCPRRARGTRSFFRDMPEARRGMPALRRGMPETLRDMPEACPRRDFIFADVPEACPRRV